jgi:hypothetical protein
MFVSVFLTRTGGPYVTRNDDRGKCVSLLGCRVSIPESLGRQYSPEPIDPPMKGMTLICCAVPVVSVDMDL